MYDPEYTPAIALRRILEEPCGESVEVIDLARTNMSFEIEAVAKAAHALEPDALVMFCGNNWVHRRFFDPAVDAAFHQQGVHGLRRTMEEQLGQRAAALVHDISLFYEERGIPVIWVAPEFNLGDWKEPGSNAPHLPGNRNALWAHACSEAEAAVRRGDWTAAAERAQRMSELDCGDAPKALYILAQCALRSGNIEDARRYLERARDSVLWDPSVPHSPRAYSIVQNVLRGIAHRPGGKVVDLPRLFQDYLGREIPDRRLFLDYCHLTAEGIRVAMAGVASCLLQVFGKRQPSIRDLALSGPSPSGRVEAESAFLAAIHNAHWYQSEDLVHHLIRKSIREDPCMGAVMAEYAELQTRRCPPLMCSVAEQIAETASPQLQQYLLRHNKHQADRVLIDAIGASGIRVDAPMQREHSVHHGQVNLLDSYYSSGSNRPDESAWTLDDDKASPVRPLFYRSHVQVARFAFIGGGGGDVVLSLCCRLAAPASLGGLMKVEVNQKCKGEFPLGSDWADSRIVVPAASVRAGWNDVALIWPPPCFDGDAGLAAAARDLSCGAVPEFFHVFGEIHSFTAFGANLEDWLDPKL